MIRAAEREGPAMAFETWEQVLEEEYGYPSCRECGYSFENVTLESVRALVRDAPPRFASLLRGHPRARTKPNEKTWSPSGYAWHVSDWLRIQGGRVYAVAHEADWTPEYWVALDPDEIDSMFHYDELPTEGGLFALEQSAGFFLEATEDLDPDQRFLHRGLGLKLRVLDIVGLVSHEIPHHEMDIRRGLGIE
jgi:hypothetical protein